MTTSGTSLDAGEWIKLKRRRMFVNDFRPGIKPVWLFEITLCIVVSRRKARALAKILTSLFRREMVDIKHVEQNYRQFVRELYKEFYWVAVWARSLTTLHCTYRIHNFDLLQWEFCFGPVHCCYKGILQIISMSEHSFGNSKVYTFKQKEVNVSLISSGSIVNSPFGFVICEICWAADWHFSWCARKHPALSPCS